jgi:hypothetical protein
MTNGRPPPSGIDETGRQESKEWYEQNQKRVVVKSSVEVSMEQVMRSSQAAAARALQSRHGVKQAFGIKSSLVGWKAEQNKSQRRTPETNYSQLHEQLLARL